MSLAAKLNRLRGRPGQSGNEALSDRLRRLRRVGERPTHTSADESAGRAPITRRPDTALCEALGAQGSDGLMRRDRVADLCVPGAELRSLHRLPEAQGLADADWVYLDTETTGLSGGAGNLAFMLGMARFSPSGRLQVRQFVLANFAAERSMLREMLDWLGSDAVLVSYNGKCFDAPLLQSRLHMHRIDADLAGRRHLDLMFTVRRAFRRLWPDCRLQTAERHLLDFIRVDDLPGAEAPAAWQDWLFRGATARLTGVLEHNYRDVVSLALLHRQLVAVYAGGASQETDHAAIGKAWHASGDQAQARHVWETAGDRLGEAGSLQLAASYRRRGEWLRAERIWLSLYAHGSRVAACELSKYHEHRRRDYAQALRFAMQAEPAEREVRTARLQGKLERGPQMPLWHAGSTGEGDEVGSAIGRRQAACQQTGAASLEQSPAER